MTNIKISLLNAILTHDTQIGSLMDPFVTFKIKDEQQKSTLLQQGGDMPEWNETFLFKNVKEQDILQVVVYDQDLTYNDLVGEIKIPIKQIFGLKQTLPKWYSLKFQKKPAGKIKLGFQVQNKNFRQQNLSFNPQLNNYTKDTSYQQTRYFSQNQQNYNSQMIMSNQIPFRSNVMLRDQRLNNKEIDHDNFQNDLYQPIKINQLNYSTSNQTLKKPQLKYYSAFLSPTHQKVVRTSPIIYSNVRPNITFTGKQFDRPMHMP